MHEHSIQLVYGGGTTGMMGAIARTLVQLSGPDAVMGVTPSSLLADERPDAPPGEGQHQGSSKVPASWKRRMGLTGGGGGKGTVGATTTDETAKLRLDSQYGHVTIVPDIQRRKRYMMELVRDGGPGSGFVALSGGIGTLDELMEVVSWNQKGAHRRGACMVNVEGYWDGVLQWLEKMIEERFAGEHVKHILGSVTDAGEAVAWLKGYEEGRASVSQKAQKGGK
ncbi:MAG: hypothetical protein LQ348_006220 [Seirophora lacunosa]|nr:MAG: hypothetical protein LQ348_006220 [Seirophora lacunosa]